MGIIPETGARSIWNGLRESRVNREFSTQVVARYLEPFTREQALTGDDLERFRDKAITACWDLARRKEELFPATSFPEADLAALLQENFSADVSGLVLERIGPLDLPGLAEFLAYRELLGNAVLFFFRERLRRDERVEKTVVALQREGLWTDVRNTKAAVEAMQYTLNTRLSELQGQIARQQQAVIQATQTGDDEHLPMLTQALQAFKSELECPFRASLQASHNAYRRPRRPGTRDTGTFEFEQRLGEEMRQTRQAVDEGVRQIRTDIHDVAQHMGKLAALVEMMHHQHLEPQVKARDEFVQHNSASLKLIYQAAEELKGIPRTRREYGLAIITVGSALASTSDGLERAERLFEQAHEAAKSLTETALASFNLFQVRLRRKAYSEALQALQAAIAIDPARYALHDAHKYPIERILGVGGMGCVFLCRDLLRDKVVVKAFWEAKKGSIEEVFREVLMLKDIAGRYIPAPIDYGYADPHAQERPYIVTAFIEGAMDGEAWLERHGKLNLAEGLQVGLQVAQGLSIAHTAGICQLDLKPANLLLNRTDQGLEVKIIDFGLARAVTSLKQEAAAQRSRNGKNLFAQEIFGTLDYASPEQLGETRYGKPGPKSDLYTFGATLYRLLSGRNPRVLNRRALPAGSPDALFDILCECLHEDPTERPESCTEIIRRLQPLVACPTHTDDAELDADVEGMRQARFIPGWSPLDTYLEQRRNRLLVWRTMAEKGHAGAQSLLGMCSLRGIGVPQDDAEAVKWYQKAAEQGYAPAQFWLSVMYATGRGVVKNEAEAVRWYQKAAAQGNADAQYNLGVRYATGCGVVKNEAEAARWYQKAAEQGDDEAQYNLGWMYDAGRGMAKNQAEAVRWYQKAAEQGYIPAQIKLGVMYVTGRGVVKSEDDAAYWYQRAAEQGYAPAQFWLGVMYAMRRGVVQNDAEAVKWYQRAAARGHAQAQCNLGWMHANGCGVAQNDAEAVKWYQKAAEQGYTRAQLYLGWMYANGRGIMQNDAEAIKWYQKAAAQGDAQAQYNLGRMYAKGRGVVKDKAEAFKWYQKAAAQGDKDAQAALERLQRKWPWLAETK